MLFDVFILLCKIYSKINTMINYVKYTLYVYVYVYVYKIM